MKFIHYFYFHPFLKRCNEVTWKKVAEYEYDILPDVYRLRVKEMIENINWHCLLSVEDDEFVFENVLRQHGN